MQCIHTACIIHSNFHKQFTKLQFRKRKFPPGSLRIVCCTQCIYLLRGDYDYLSFSFQLCKLCVIFIQVSCSALGRAVTASDVSKLRLYSVIGKLHTVTVSSTGLFPPPFFAPARKIQVINRKFAFLTELCTFRAVLHSPFT